MSSGGALPRVLAGAVMALSSTGVGCKTLAQDCKSEVKLRLATTAEEPWRWTMRSARYRVKVTGAGLDALCAFEMPYQGSSCTSERLSVISNAKGVTGFRLLEPPATIRVAVVADDEPSFTRDLSIPRPARCQAAELGLDLPTSLRGRIGAHDRMDGENTP